jgi:hypothetical protein
VSGAAGGAAERAQAGLGREPGVQPVGRVAVPGEGVAGHAPAPVADLVAVGDGAAEGRAFRARAAAAQVDVAAHDRGLGAAGLGLAVDRQHAALEPALDGQRAREGVAPARREHRLAELAHPRLLLRREQRAEVGAVEEGERVGHLVRRVVGGQHDQGALARRERGRQAPQRVRVRGIRAARGKEPARAEAAAEQQSGPGTHPDQEALARERHAATLAESMRGAARAAGIERRRWVRSSPRSCRPGSSPPRWRASSPRASPAATRRSHSG